MEQAQGTLWAGTLPGGLFRSADGGDNRATVLTLLPPLYPLGFV